MISSLLKQVMTELELRQRDLAEVLGVPLDRVKSLTSGKVSKLTREESEALVKKLHVRGDWLATGEGDVFQSSVEQRMTGDLQSLQSISEDVAKMGLPREQAMFARDIAYGVVSQNENLLKTTLFAHWIADEPGGREAQAVAIPPIDRDLMADICEVVELELGDLKRTVVGMPMIMDVCCEVYNHLVEEGGGRDIEDITRLVRLVLKALLNYSRRERESKRKRSRD